MLTKVAQYLLLLCGLWLPWLNLSHGGEFVQRVFDSRDGLSNGMINAISFDDYGFVWVGTEDGLFRVSKTMVRRIDTYQGENRLSNVYIKDVVALGPEYLLISLNDTLFRYHIPSDAFEEFGTATLLPDYDGGGLASQSPIDDHSLMLLTTKGQLLRLDYGDWTMDKLSQLQQEPDQPWAKLLVLGGDRLLLARKFHLELRSYDGQTISDLPWNEATGQIKSLYRDRTGQVWLSSSEGLFEVNPETLTVLPVTEVPFYVTAMAEDAKGSLWLASRAGLLKWTPTTRLLEKFETELHQLANIDYVLDVAIDHQGLIWLGGAGEGLALALDTPAFVRDKFNGRPPYELDNQMIWSIYSEGANYWFGSAAGVVRLTAGQSGSMLTAPAEFEVNDSVYGISALDNDYLLLTTTNGLFVQHKQTNQSMRFAQWSHGSESLEHKSIYQAYQDPEAPGRRWFLTTTGLFYWEPGMTDPRKFEIQSRQGKGPNLPLLNMLRDSRGTLWLGSAGGFGYLDSEGYYVDKGQDFEGLGGDFQVRQMLEIAPGKLWLGTSLFGVLEYQPDNESWVSLQGKWQLSCYNTYGLVDAGDYRLIICPRSLVRQHKETGEVQVFSAEDGIIRSEFNESAFAYRPDLGLFLGSPAGARLLDINTLENRIIDERVFLESVTVYYDDHVEKSLVPSDTTAMAPGARMISLQLTSNDFLDQSPIRFKYRLNRTGELDESKYLLLDGQPQLNLSGLNVGRLELEILNQRNEQWNSVPYRHHLDVQQSWWKSLWFKWSMIVALIGLIMAIMLVRQRQVSRFRAMNLALMESDDRLRQSLRGSDSDLWRWRRDDNTFYLDNRNGVLSGESAVLAIPLERFAIHPDDRDRVEARWQAVVDGEVERLDIEYRFRRTKDSWGWLRVRGRPSQVNRETGAVEQISGIYSDISQHKELQNEVDLLAQAFENTSEGVLILDADEQIKVANRAAQSILDCTMSELAGRSFISLLTDKGTDLCSVSTLLNQGTTWTGECEFGRSRGPACPVWLNVSVMLGQQGKVQHYVVVFSDITERKRSEADLRHLANYDVLTGLPNRSLFATNLEQAIQTANRHDDRLALLFLDLDRFKHVNDSYGHSMGDALLVEAANRLQSCIGPEHSLCRFGGDEFVILTQGADVDTLNHLASSILQQIETPFKLFGREFFISTSIGIAIWPDDARQPEALIKNADLAMYHAKDEGRGNFQYYSQERNAEALYHLRLEADLRKALERGEFFLVYQPQVDVAQQQLPWGMEALVRWRHPQDGLIATDVFIRVAEACGLVIDIDKWVLRQACRDGVRWSQLLGRPFQLSVNISAVHFRQPDFIDNLCQTLQDTGMPAEYLALEITEGVLMKELQIAQEHLRRLRTMGVQVAIDDFGTGYSSLAYLRQFDVHVLKIDRSFLIDIADSPADQAIVASIINLAKNLQLQVVAEGVETQAQLEKVLELGCHIIQGYYFAKPMAAEALDAYLGLVEEVPELCAQR